ncbi:hypothetical protein N5D48_22335, partial [Pseudomonas sp. GD03858]|uniref:hypothetical protein n=1 Tax=Pseudomonas sp. GD03858 TaxID=2975388 RepID=UPI0024471017
MTINQETAPGADRVSILPTLAVPSTNVPHDAATTGPSRTKQATGGYAADPDFRLRGNYANP